MFQIIVVCSMASVCQRQNFVYVPLPKYAANKVL